MDLESYQNQHSIFIEDYQTVISSTETEHHSVECQNWSEVVQSNQVHAEELEIGCDLPTVPNPKFV